jgi:hypothetical protein
MSSRLLAANVVLVALGLGAAAYIVREVTARPPETPPVAVRPAPTLTPAPAPAPSAPGTYGMVASRNLFSPTRSETVPATATGTAAAAQQVPKPALYGVVLRDGAPIAYLEDPVTKRVAGYRVGDTVAGGTLQTIGADRVVLTRPEGQVDVRLHDPSRPRPAGPSVGATPARQPGVPGTPPAVGAPSGPAAQLPPNLQPGRRVLPPNLRRRLPPGFGNDAAND